MTFEEAVEAYARRTFSAWFASMQEKGWHTFADFNVRHEEGWSNDSGTYWPAETVIRFIKTKTGAKGRKHSRWVELYARESDPVDFMRALFRQD